MRTILFNTVTNLSRLLLILGVVLILSMSGFSLWEDGRMTDAACYLIIGLLFYGTARLWALDRAVARGEVDENSLPRFLRSEV